MSSKVVNNQFNNGGGLLSSVRLCLCFTDMSPRNFSHIFFWHRAIKWHFPKWKPSLCTLIELHSNMMWWFPVGISHNLMGKTLKTKWLTAAILKKSAWCLLSVSISFLSLSTFFQGEGVILFKLGFNFYTSILGPMCLGNIYLFTSCHKMYFPPKEGCELNIIWRDSSLPSKHEMLIKMLFYCLSNIKTTLVQVLVFAE